MLGRLVLSADFERALAQPASARSPHFAVHFAPERPVDKFAGSSRARPDSWSLVAKLSTVDEQGIQQSVDESPLSPSELTTAERASEARLGAVVPKRHARRAVTRTLIKRQIRSAAQALDAGSSPLSPGLWVVRLRAPFDRAAHVSAASAALRKAARDELDSLLLLALRKLQSVVAEARRAI